MGNAIIHFKRDKLSSICNVPGTKSSAKIMRVLTTGNLSAEAFIAFAFWVHFKLKERLVSMN